MRTPWSQLPPATAILTLAEIKAAVEAFDRGDANAFDALDAIVVAIEATQPAARPERWRDAA